MEDAVSMVLPAKEVPDPRLPLAEVNVRDVKSDPASMWMVLGRWRVRVIDPLVLERIFGPDRLAATPMAPPAAPNPPPAPPMR